VIFSGGEGAAAFTAVRPHYITFSQGFKMPNWPLGGRVESGESRVEGRGARVGRACAALGAVDVDKA
jgi:hypothetical protein